MDIHDMIAIKDFHHLNKGDEVRILFSSVEDTFYRLFTNDSDGQHSLSKPYPMSILYDSFREKTEDEKTIGFCESCDTRIKETDNYLENPESDEFYCSNCYEGYPITTYTICGEFVGTDDDGWYENT